MVLVFLQPSPQSGKVEHSYNNNMKRYLFFLGSNPTLSAVECWTTLARAGLAPRVLAAHQSFFMLSLARALPEDWLKRLGGIDRVALLRSMQNHLWEAKEIIDELSPAPPKFSLGISTFNVASGYAKKVSFEVKKLWRQDNVRLSFILPKGKDRQLNAAQVIFNKLTSPPNKELTILQHDNYYLLAETIQIQDIQAYERRDTRRPVRDARVGMLPPKLAQIMLNLVPEFVGSPPVVLDPFCGAGTVLQEGYLMGYKMIGSDVSERMVKAAKENLDFVESIATGPVGWLCTPTVRPRPPWGGLRATQRGTPSQRHPSLGFRVFQHNARDPFPEDLVGGVDAVVTEPNLGEPLTTPLPGAEARERMRELSSLYLSFFVQIKLVLKNGGWVVFALPAFRQGPVKNSGFNLFPASFLDEVEKLGYCWNQLLPYELKQYYAASERGSIIYARPDALVGRELTLWHIKKPGARHN